MRASTPKAVSEPKTPGTGPAFRLPFDNSFFRDMQGFYVPWKPEPSPAPAWVQFNDALALELGLEPATLKSATGLAWLSGVEMPAEAAPLAQAYAGHQFGQFSPHLGDGRALLLGELIDTAGQRRDLALKGSGRTPFSRRGDGKAALGPALREYLMGEAMHALGIPTTRALAVIRTGERVNREGSPPGAILVRVAASHLRVGTFEFFAAREEEVMLRRLLDYAVARHDPALAKLSDKPIPMLEAVCERQAQLIARWMGVGFIHGVMNTDNMSISGETIDYGPCAFMEGFDPATVFSSIDRQGRYAYGQQPAMAQWNLARLAEALLPVLDARDIDVVERVEQVVAGNGDSIFKRLMACMGRPDLGSDPALASNAGRVARVAELDEAIGTWAATLTVDAALAALAQAEVPAGKIYTVADIATDPHYAARGMLQSLPQVDGSTMLVPGVVPKLLRTPGGQRRAAPALGQDTDAVLASMGLSAAQVAELKARGIVQAG